MLIGPIIGPFDGVTLEDILVEIVVVDVLPSLAVAINLIFTEADRCLLYRNYKKDRILHCKISGSLLGGTSSDAAAAADGVGVEFEFGFESGSYSTLAGFVSGSYST